MEDEALLRRNASLSSAFGNAGAQNFYQAIRPAREGGLIELIRLFDARMEIVGCQRRQKPILQLVSV